MTAEYRYDTAEDCFVMEDRDSGEELCRTPSPHHLAQRGFLKTLVDATNNGHLIFPKPHPAPCHQE